MSKKKSTINWPFVVIGIFLLYAGFSENPGSIQQDSLTTLSDELSSDMTNIRGRRGSIDMKFWTKKYDTQFNILKGTLSGGRHAEVLELKRGQEVEFEIRKSELERLYDKANEATVYGLKIDGKSLLSAHEFQTNRHEYEIRIAVMSVFVGCMLLLNGFWSVSAKINYLLGGTFILAFIIMRIFHIVLY